MALTGKTIGQLTYLQYPTNDTLIPVELSGNTYHISFSAVNYTEVTYSDLSSGLQSAQLTPGQYYLITDFQTIYDQPNFDSNGSPITIGNNKSGSTEPLLVLAISTSQLAPTAYSTIHPTDKITYDVTWYETEVTLTPAKGRITERIDSRGNRTDYDFRAVRFIRYVGYFSEDTYSGTLSIDSAGVVTGVDTQFLSDFSVGMILGVYVGAFNAPTSCFKYYKILTIDSDTSMTVEGRTITPYSNTFYSRGRQLASLMSPFQNNVTGDTADDSAEFLTFNSDRSYTTYIGDYTDIDTFILSNNVFLSGDYNSNVLGPNSIGNTFNDDMDSNTLGAYSSYNIITNDFDKNTTGPNFSYNIIDCDFMGNIIGERFRFNMIGDEDATDFDYNTIQSDFYSNFITMSNTFIGNSIGYDFRENFIDGTFINNTISNLFNRNEIRSSFSNNIIENSFETNKIFSLFNENKIGNLFQSNVIAGNFDRNIIGNSALANTIGDPLAAGGFSFENNVFGNNFSLNFFSGQTSNNVCGNNFGSNSIDYNFSYNQIANDFGNNTIGHDFGFGGGVQRGNIIGNNFNSNTVGEYCYDNTFGDNCSFNNLSEYFTNNKISYGFNSTTVLDIDSGNYFQNNTISYGYFSRNLTLSGGNGGNPVLYSNIPTNITLDYVDGFGYVTFLSGGSIISQTVIV